MTFDHMVRKSRQATPSMRTYAARDGQCRILLTRIAKNLATKPLPWL
jgi:hypothetical protein